MNYARATTRVKWHYHPQWETGDDGSPVLVLPNHEDHVIGGHNPFWHEDHFTKRRLHRDPMGFHAMTTKRHFVTVASIPVHTKAKIKTGYQWDVAYVVFNGRKLAIDNTETPEIALANVKRNLR
jgi:hypothetical protein